MNRASPAILIVKLSAIGDVVHTLPALNALRRRFPGAHITWLVEEAAAGLLTGHPALDRVLVSRRKTWLAGLKTRHWKVHLKQILAFLEELRDTRYDLVLDFQAALKGAMLIALARGKRKIGFGPGMQHQEHSYIVLNERIPMVSMQMHALERSLAMIEKLGSAGYPVEYNLPINAAHMHTARGLLSRIAAQNNHRTIAMIPVAKWRTKLWLNERWAALADELIDSDQAAVVFTGSPADIETIDHIRSKMRNTSVNLAGRTNLLELAAVYRQMTCVICTDTGPMHMAAAVGTPVVALFGPTSARRTGPYGPGHKIISLGLNCRPCFKRSCDTAKCMTRIQVADVLKAARDLLGISERFKG